MFGRYCTEAIRISARGGAYVRPSVQSQEIPAIRLGPQCNSTEKSTYRDVPGGWWLPSELDSQPNQERFGLFIRERYFSISILALQLHMSVLIESEVQACFP